MMELRDQDVHTDDIALSVRVSAIPAYLVSGVSVFPGVPGSSVSNPVPGAEPASAPAFVSFEKYRLEGDEASSTCEKFIGHIEDLVRYCQSSGTP
jgi:hypothetical protein